MAFITVLASSSPRFVFWDGIVALSIPEPFPETNRAWYSLRQLHTPFAPINNSANAVIRWRLLFPLLGRVLHLPDLMYLALPAIGCVLALGFTARVLSSVSGNQAAVALGTALTGTASWFLVSTGWLGYFDSWYILGLLVVSFSTSRRATTLACLTTPWIDERFVLALPLCLLVRRTWFEETGGRGGREVWGDLLWSASLVGPYVLARLVILALGPDPKSSVHLSRHLLQERPTVGVFASGLWMALRGNWALVLLAVYLAGRRRPILAALMALAGLLTSVAAGLLAHDLSRSFSVLVPLSVLGTVMVLRAWPRAATAVLAALFALNLFTPVRHVVVGWDEIVMIRSLPHELEQLRRPPPLYYLSRGNGLLLEGRRGEARALFEHAAVRHPNSPDVQAMLGVCRMHSDQPRAAISAFSAAIRLEPRNAFARYSRGSARLRIGDASGAADDLRTALELNPNPGRLRRRIEADLKRAESLLAQPGGTDRK